MNTKRAKRLQYTNEDLKKAVEAIEAGMAFKAASKTYGIPRATLQDKVKGRTLMDKKSGPETVLTKDEEMLLVNWLLYISKCGFPGTKNQLLDSVEMLVKNLQRPNNFTDGRPGRRWYEGFMARHPELTRRVSQNLTSSRANLTENRIRQWFKEVEIYLRSTDNFDITSDPSRIFNCDETAFFLSPKADKVLVKRGDKAVYTFISNDEKECLTTLVTCSASGQLPPPMIVYSYKRIPKAVVDKVPKTWGIGRSENGWMTGETFFEYVANIFYPWLVDQKIQLPAILFLDGHTSHLTMSLSEFCSKNNIILIALCPNATHILQPLDVAVFRPLKMEWKKSVHCWRMEHNGQKMNREVFAPILETTFKKMEKIPGIIKNGFRTCGLVPFNADSIRYSKYFKTVGDNTSTEAVQQQAVDNISVLKCLESEIVGDTLAMFESSGENWDGPIEDKSLFFVWRNIKSRVKQGGTLIENNQVAAASSTPVSSENNLESTDEMDITRIFNLDSYSFPIYLDVHDEILNVPSAVNIGLCHGSESNERTRGAGTTINETNTCETVGQLKEVDTESNKTYLLGPVDVLEDTPMITDIIIHEPSTQVSPLTEKTTNCTEQNDLDKGQTLSNEIPKTPPENITSPAEKENQNEIVIPSIKVPTPFKKSLFWPDPKTVSVKRKIKEKIPAVATSVQWQQYFKSKEEKKRNEEERKMQKQEERKKKQVEQGNKKKKTYKSDDAHQTSADQTTDNNQDYQLNDFVVAVYNDQHYPGKIIAIKNENDYLQYEVTHMEKRGINWFWPEKPDILLYEKKEILKKISAPKLKNKRGLFEVNEISDFSI